MRTKSASIIVPLAFIAIIAALSATAATQQAPAPAPAAQSPQTTPAMPSCPELATAVLRHDVRLRDWANLTRYRDANRTLTPVTAGENRVVFMGDSITDAWPMYGDVFVNQAYVGRGISGQTTPQMLVRFRPDVID